MGCFAARVIGHIVIGTDVLKDRCILKAGARCHGHSTEVCKSSGAASYDVSGALHVAIAGDVDVSAKTQFFGITSRFLGSTPCILDTLGNAHRIGAHRKSYTLGKSSGQRDNLGSSTRYIHRYLRLSAAVDPRDVTSKAVEVDRTSAQIAL